MAYEKEYNIIGSEANTLKTDCLGINKSGWTIEGEIHIDYYEWINEFKSSHPVYGKVWGDFEKVVFAETEKGFNHFVKNHEPESWDYWDI